MILRTVILQTILFCGPGECERLLTRRLRCSIVLCSISTPRERRFTHFPSFQQHKIQEPRLVHFAEVDFLRMVPDEVEDVLFTDAMDIVAIPIVPVCALQAILQPAVRDPPANLVVVLPRHSSSSRIV